jgi:hypothetical protein
MQLIEVYLSAKWVSLQVSGAPSDVLLPLKLHGCLVQIPGRGFTDALVDGEPAVPETLACCRAFATIDSISDAR